MAIPPLFLVGVIVADLGLVLHILAITTVEWATGKDDDVNSGLFGGWVDDVYYEDIEKPSSELKRTRILVILGMLVAIAGVGLGVLFIILQGLGKYPMKIFVTLSGQACIVAAILNIIGVIIYAAEVYGPASEFVDLGYSFDLCVMGVIFLGISGILILLGGQSVV